MYEYTQGFVETERRCSDSEKETLQLILKGCVAVSEMDWSIWGKAFFLLSQPRQAKFKVPKEWPLYKIPKDWNLEREEAERQTSPI